MIIDDAPSQFLLQHEFLVELAKRNRDDLQVGSWLSSWWYWSREKDCCVCRICGEGFRMTDEDPHDAKHLKLMPFM